MGDDTHFGAYSVRKVAALKTPAKFPSPTNSPVFDAREFSWILLLLCHAWTRQDGMYDPAAMRKHAKYATPLCWVTFKAARINIPISDNAREKTM